MLLFIDFPGVPTGLDVSDVTGHSAVLSWQLLNDGNSPITQYFVLLTESQTGQLTQFVVASGNQTSLEVMTLSPVTNYRFVVIAQNEVGNSTASQPRSFVSRGLPPDVSPVNVSVVDVQGRSVSLEWKVSLSVLRVPPIQFHTYVCVY